MKKPRPQDRPEYQPNLTKRDIAEINLAAAEREVARYEALTTGQRDGIYEKRAYAHAQANIIKYKALLTGMSA